MSVSDFCIKFIREFEQFRASVYLDAGGLETVGYGHLVVPGDGFFSSKHNPNGKDHCTREEGELLLSQDVLIASTAVDRLVAGCTVVPREIDALVSFTFNVGVANLETSTLLKHLRAGNRLAAAREFRLWHLASGKHKPGLRRRRIAEELWFLGGHPDSVMNIARDVWD